VNIFAGTLCALGDVSAYIPAMNFSVAAWILSDIIKDAINDGR